MKRLLNHRGYYGSLEISLEDECLYGKILFIKDLISYEGDNVRALENAFKEAVDDYLETCNQEGKTPNRPFSGTFNVRVGEDLHRQAAIYAEKEGGSLNDLVRKAIENYLNAGDNSINIWPASKRGLVFIGASEKTAGMWTITEANLFNAGLEGPGFPYSPSQNQALLSDNPGELNTSFKTHGVPLEDDGDNSCQSTH